MEIIKKLTFARINIKMLPSKGRRQHFYDRVFFDSADSVHHVVEPIAAASLSSFVWKDVLPIKYSRSAATWSLSALPEFEIAFFTVVGESSQ